MTKGNQCLGESGKASEEVTFEEEEKHVLGDEKEMTSQ